jgi:hypothetical protein
VTLSWRRSVMVPFIPNRTRVAKAVLVSSVVPYVLKDGNNPDGVDPAVFDTMKAQIRQDRFAFLQPSASNSTASAE